MPKKNTYNTRVKYNFFYTSLIIINYPLKQISTISFHCEQTIHNFGVHFWTGSVSNFCLSNQWRARLYSKFKLQCRASDGRPLRRKGWRGGEGGEEEGINKENLTGEFISRIIRISSSTRRKRRIIF